MESDTPAPATTENGTVLGIDLGVNNLAVASTGTFWTGDEFGHWRHEYENRRGDLRECGTRWAHENMQAVGRKEDGRFKLTLHRIANELVHEAHEHDEYKAKECAIVVEQVNPENTSRRCSTCGFTHPDNREGESFACRKCGYENHADYNSMKNIGLRYLRRNQTGGDRGALLGVRLNSGTLNVNGEYESPAEVSARTGVHAESHRFSGG